MKALPVTLSFDGSRLRIDCLTVFNKRALKPLDQGKRDGIPAADLFEAGVIQGWSGRYPMTDELSRALHFFLEKRKMPAVPFGDHLDVQVQIRRLPAWRGSPALTSFFRGLTGERRPLRVYIRPGILLPAHAASPLFRRLWGVFKSGQIESIGMNWSPRFPGYITIPVNTPAFRFQGVAAHEAGHIFGLGDAYGAWYRFFHAAPGTRGFMMRDNSRVHPRELAMLLTAHARGKMQYFPRRFHFRTVMQGLYLSLKSPFLRLFRKGNR